MPLDAQDLPQQSAAWLSGEPFQLPKSFLNDLIDSGLRGEGGKLVFSQPCPMPNRRLEEREELPSTPLKGGGEESLSVFEFRGNDDTFARHVKELWLVKEQAESLNSGQRFGLTRGVMFRQRLLANNLCRPARGDQFADPHLIVERAFFTKKLIQTEVSMIVTVAWLR